MRKRRPKSNLIPRRRRSQDRTGRCAPSFRFRGWRASRRYWFDASPDFDELVRQRLAPFYSDAIAGRLDHWKDHPDGALALCILFDQVPRNIFRGLICDAKPCVFL
jgi:uncharacterized protein (DUF924 family)